MVRHESNVGKLTLEAFAAAYDEVERAMLTTEEMQLEGCSVEPHVTAVGRALRVACRLAAGRPGWKLFTETHVVEAGPYRITLTPSSSEFFEEETIVLRRIEREADQGAAGDDQVEDRPLVVSYREPRTARELARFIETSLLDGFGLHVSGGVVLDGAIFDVELQDEGGDTAVVVMPADDWRALQGKRGKSGQTPYWLDAGEVELIEAHRESKRPPEGAAGGAGSRFCPAAN